LPDAVGDISSQVNSAIEFAAIVLEPVIVCDAHALAVMALEDEPLTMVRFVPVNPVHSGRVLVALAVGVWIT
jgi:hypothetical protein